MGGKYNLVSYGINFGAVALAFIGTNDAHDMSLASNRYYSLAVVLIIYWLATFISLKGMGWVGKVAKVGGMVGTIIPAGLLMVLAVIYLASGGQSQMNFDGNSSPISVISTIWYLHPVFSFSMPVWKWAVSM